MKMGPEDHYSRKLQLPYLRQIWGGNPNNITQEFSIKIFRRHNAFQRIMQILHAVCHLAHLIVSWISAILFLRSENLSELLKCVAHFNQLLHAYKKSKIEMQIDTGIKKSCK